MFPFPIIWSHLPSHEEGHLQLLHADPLGGLPWGMEALRGHRKMSMALCDCRPDGWWRLQWNKRHGLGLSRSSKKIVSNDSTVLYMPRWRSWLYYIRRRKGKKCKIVRGSKNKQGRILHDYTRCLEIIQNDAKSMVLWFKIAKEKMRVRWPV